MVLQHIPTSGDICIGTGTDEAAIPLTCILHTMTCSEISVKETYVHGKNKSRQHAFSSGKHIMQNAARCRDMLQHLGCMIHAQLMLHYVTSFLVSCEEALVNEAFPSLFIMFRTLKRPQSLRL